MKPETAAHLAIATVDLDNAQTVARLLLAHLAARSAYYAAFHAAEALISERTGKSRKRTAGSMWSSRA